MKSLLTWVLDAVAPRKWHLVKRNPGGSVSICSSHRSRADAVLAIPLHGDYSVMQQERINLINAWAAYSAAQNTQEES